MAGTVYGLTDEPEDYLVRYTWKVNAGLAFPEHTFEVAYNLARITASARIMRGQNGTTAALTLEAVDVKTRGDIEWTSIALMEPEQAHGEAVAA